jgi:hypothetical protein
MKGTAVAIPKERKATTARTKTLARLAVCPARVESPYAPNAAPVPSRNKPMAMDGAWPGPVT